MEISPYSLKAGQCIVLRKNGNSQTGMLKRVGSGLTLIDDVPGVKPVRVVERRADRFENLAKVWADGVTYVEVIPV